MIERIVNIETGEVTERPYTAEEIAASEAEAERIADELAQLEAKAEARKAIFEKLGLTEEEARILLG